MKRMKFSMLLATASFFCLSLSLTAQPQPRKKVGVVLSGGGAKGMAHIGALKVIEKAGIPIDYVVGTSMGSIIGGLYAIGYTPEQMDSMVRRQDWTILLSDKIPRSEQNMAEREASEKYVFSIPFGKGVKAKMSGGLIKGINLANLFSELTLGYHDSVDFNKLPIPFACVSENIVTGNEVNFHEGILATAMRASMAIPGVFTPVRLDSMVLVDGGVINNYPVNVARAMGADLIIGVDVQNGLKSAGELNSASSVLGQLINLMGLDMYRKNLKETNTYIKVDVEGYTAASFTPSAIDTLIRRGEEAALAQDSALMHLKRELGLDSNYMPKPLPPYPYSPNRKVYVKEITFDKLDPKDKKWILKRCDLKENSEISIRRIEEATATLCSTLGFSSATYNLPKVPGGGHNLNFILTKKYENKLNLGIRFDSEEIASLLINTTSNFKGKIPSTLSLTGRLGKRYAARIDYGIEPAPLKNLGLAYMFQYNDINFYHHGDRSHNSTFRYHMAEFSFTDVWYKNLRLAFGLRYELYDYDKFLYQEGGNRRQDVGTEHFFSYYAQMKYETFDKAYFPSKGVSALGAYSLFTDNFTQYDGHSPFSAVKGYFEGVIPLTHRFSVLPGIYGRFLIGKGIPYSKLNAMGGYVPGRFLPQQLPFVGINNVELMKNSLLIGSMKFRQRIGNVHYVTLTGNYALSAGKLQHLLDEDTRFGCGIGYGLDSIFGPLEASLNYANRSDKVSLYVNLGFYF